MKSSCVVAVLVLASIPLPAQAQQPFVLTDGTPVRVRLNRNLSSAEAKVGDPVDFDVVEDILVNGTLIIERGSRVLATITDAAQGARMGKAGRLTVSIDHGRSVLGEKIALRAVKENKKGHEGGSNSAVDIASSIVTAPLFLFMKGKEITIPKGTEVTAYVHGDVRLDEARLRAAHLNSQAARETATPKPPEQAAESKADSAPQRVVPQQSAPASGAAPPPQPAAVPAPRASGMSNADVLALREAGFSDDLIVAKIKSSRGAFRMETSDMLELKKAGLSDRVISAMLDKTQ